MNLKKIFTVIITLLFILSNSLISRADQIWFDDIKSHKELNPEQALGLAQAVFTAIKNSKDTINTDGINVRNRPSIVYISASDSVTIAHVGIGTGADLISATNNALSNIYKALPEGFNLEWLKIDIVKKVNKVDDFSFREAEYFDYTLYGIAFNEQSGIALIPEEVNAAVIVNDNFIDKYVLSNHLHKKPHRYKDYKALKYWDNTELYLFTTESYFYDANNINPLFRGHRIDFDVNEETLHTSARLAGKYLLDAIKPDGSYIYRYYPESDLSANDYNILRHAGSTYVLLELYENTVNQQILEQARLTIDYLKRFTKLCKLDGVEYQCVIDEPEYLVKLGGNGLASLVVAKYIKLSGDKSFLEYLDGVNSYLLRAIKDNGEFYPHIVEFFTGTVRNTSSDYYPGEAIYALLMSYEVTNDQKLLDGAIKASDYLIKIRDKGKTVDNINHDHWFVYALSMLYKHKPDQLYLDHIFKICDAIANSQKNNYNTVDLNGSYYDKPNSTPSATRSEALYTGYNMAKKADDEKRADKYMKALKAGIKFQLYFQYMPESVMYLPDPQQALGGFKNGYYETEIQNDVVQHSLSSILGLISILHEEN